MLPGHGGTQNYHSAGGPARKMIADRAEPSSGVGGLGGEHVRATGVFVAMPEPWLPLRLAL